MGHAPPRDPTSTEPRWPVLLWLGFMVIAGCVLAWALGGVVAPGLLAAGAGLIGLGWLPAPPPEPAQRSVAPSHPVWAGASTVERARRRYIADETSVEEFEAELALAMFVEEAREPQSARREREALAAEWDAAWERACDF